jgi:hypothetical protein
MHPALPMLLLDRGVDCDRLLRRWLVIGFAQQLYVNGIWYAMFLLKTSILMMQYV